jgi:hypothetical protein
MRYRLTPEQIAIIRSRCVDTEVIAAFDEQDGMNYAWDRYALIEEARDIHGNDDIEIDDDANLSRGDDGCWVQGWLWVPSEVTP